MPRPTKKNSPTSKATRSHEDRDNKYEALQTQVDTIKWVIAVIFALFLIALATVAQFTLDNSRKNDALRTDHNNLRVEFEVYKAQNPPIATIPLNSHSVANAMHITKISQIFLLTSPITMLQYTH